MNIQPLDFNPEFEKLVTAFGDGKKFSIDDAVKVLDLSYAKTREFLAALRFTLEDCPEGIQLTVKRGQGEPGHQFTQPIE